MDALTLDKRRISMIMRRVLTNCTHTSSFLCMDAGWSKHEFGAWPSPWLRDNGVSKLSPQLSNCNQCRRQEDEDEVQEEEEEEEQE